MNKKRMFLSIIEIIIGVVIIFAPTIITGKNYNVNETMGDLLVAEFVLRTLSFIIGLIIIYLSIKKFDK